MRCDRVVCSDTGCIGGGICNPDTDNRCSDNTDCPEGFICSGIDILCAECEEGTECAPCIGGEGYCIPGNTECSTDNDCPEGYYCASQGDVRCIDEDNGLTRCVTGGVCLPLQEECTDDSMCPEGMICQIISACPVCDNGEYCPDMPCIVSGECVPAQGNDCMTDDDCARGFRCDIMDEGCYCDPDGYCECRGGSGICVPATGECIVDTDCPEGFMCEYTGFCPECDGGDCYCVEGGFCVPQERRCENDGDCGEGFYCELSYDCPECECLEGTECDCDCVGGGVCRPNPEGECRVDTDCPEGFMCVYTGLCDPDSSEPCFVGGFCVPMNNECRTDDDCLPNQICTFEYDCVDDPQNSGVDCGGVGYCVDAPVDSCLEACGYGCPAPEYWVCGEDGNFYCNTCYMNCYGVQEASNRTICESTNR